MVASELQLTLCPDSGGSSLRKPSEAVELASLEMLEAGLDDWPCFRHSKSQFPKEEWTK